MQHKSDSRRCSGSGNAIGRWLLSSVLLLLLGALTHALPITSKPIEGNAQRIAWDEWLRLPQEQKTQEKEKKVTAKSIFTLPFRQCPPGHKLYNERCIPLVNFDPTELLTQELLGLVGGGGDAAGGLNIGINGDDLIEQYDYDGDGDADEAAMVFDEAYPLAVPSPSSSEKSVVQLPMEQLPPSDDAPLKFNIFEKKYPSDYSEVGGDGDASGSATADDATIEQLGSGGSGSGGGGNSTTTTNTTELESSTLLNSTDITTTTTTTTTPTNDDLLALSTNYSFTSNINYSNNNSSNFSFDDIQAIVLPASVVQAFPKNQMTPNAQLLKSDEDTVPMPAYSNSRATPTLSVYETNDDRSTTTTMTSTLMTQMPEEDEAMKDATLEQNEATVELMKQTAIPLKDEHTRSITESSTNANSFEDSTKISSTLAQTEQSSALVAEDLTTNTISELVATATTTITELATKQQQQAQQQENPTQMKSKTNIELKKSKVEPVAVTVDVVGSAGSVVADFMISSAESKADKTATTTTAATTTAATTTETAKVVAVDDSAAAAASASAHVSVSNVANRTLFDANVDAIIANDIQIRSDDRFYYQHLGVTQSDGNADGNDGGGDKSSATTTTPSTTITTTTTTSENEMMNTIVVGHIVDNERQKDEPIKVFIIGDNENNKNNNNNRANKTEEINLEQKLREINELVKRGQQQQQQPPQQYAQSTTPTTPSIETNKISMLPIITTPTTTSEMPLVTVTNTATTTTTTAFADRDNNSLPATADEAAATTTPTILMSTVANSTTNVMSTTASITASTTALPSSSPSSAATTTTAATTTLSINSNRSNRNSKIIKINSLVETSTEPATTTTTIATTNLLKQETITSATTTTTTSDTTNSSSSYQPFWWLPLGWRLDRSTDRSANNQSFLMRFFTDFRLPRTTTTDMKIAKDSRGL